MANVRREVVNLTTDGAGDAVGYTQQLSGKVHQIAYVKNDFANGVDFAVTTEETGLNIWTEANVNASALRAPRQPTHGQDGTASLFASGGEPVEDKIAVADERIKVVVAQGGAGKSGKVILYIE